MIFIIFDSFMLKRLRGSLFRKFDCSNFLIGVMFLLSLKEVRFVFGILSVIVRVLILFGFGYFFFFLILFR